MAGVSPYSFEAQQSVGIMYSGLVHLPHTVEGALHCAQLKMCILQFTLNSLQCAQQVLSSLWRLCPYFPEWIQAYTRYTQGIHLAYTMHTPDIHQSYTMCTPSLHHAYTRHTSVIHKVYSRYIPAIHNVYTRHTLCMQHTPNIRKVYIIYIPSIYQVHTRHTPDRHQA